MFGKHFTYQILKVQHDTVMAIISSLDKEDCHVLAMQLGHFIFFVLFLSDLFGY